MREVSGVGIFVSPQFSGPAVVAEMIVQVDVGAAANFPTIGIYYASDNAGGGNNQAIGTVPSGTRIFENLTNARDDAFQATDALGFPVFTVAGGIGFQRFPLFYPVPLTQFFLKLRFANNNAVVHAAQGYLRVLEAVPLDQLGNFL